MSAILPRADIGWHRHQASANDCDFNRSMQHLSSHYRAGGVDNEAKTEFQGMVAEIKAEMATQLERLRAMEASGELEPIPDID